MYLIGWHNFCNNRSIKESIKHILGIIRQFYKTNAEVDVHVVSLSNNLKMSKSSDFTRKHKIAVNPPCRKHRSCVAVDPELITIKPKKRVKDHPTIRSRSSTVNFYASCRKELCKLVAQLPSATAKWVFSLLKSTFRDRQDNPLKDYIETSVVLSYNKKLFNMYVLCVCNCDKRYVSLVVENSDERSIFCPHNVQFTCTFHTLSIMPFLM